MTPRSLQCGGGGGDASGGDNGDNGDGGDNGSGDDNGDTDDDDGGGGSGGDNRDDAFDGVYIRGHDNQNGTDLLLGLVRNAAVKVAVGDVSANNARKARLLHAQGRCNRLRRQYHHPHYNH